jgi:hypothetical protein
VTECQLRSVSSKAFCPPFSTCSRKPVYAPKSASAAPKTIFETCGAFFEISVALLNICFKSWATGANFKFRDEIRFISLKKFSSFKWFSASES